MLSHYSVEYCLLSPSTGGSHLNMTVASTVIFALRTLQVRKQLEQIQYVCENKRRAQSVSESEVVHRVDPRFWGLEPTPR